jgi:hypothetical protein
MERRRVMPKFAVVMGSPHQNGKRSRQSNLSRTVSKEYSFWKSDLDKSRGTKVL